MTQKAYTQDISEHGDYIYTTDEHLSASLANVRIRRALDENASYAGKTIIDIGSGDGNFTHELIERGAKSILGIDPVQSAVDAANKKYAGVPNMRFECHDICTMPVPKEKFDLAMVRGVLHHIPDMDKGIKAICSVAKEVIMVDPNGYNPVLKIIEKASAYHREHGERSYFPRNIRKTFRKYNATLVRTEYVNLVPFFCPDWLAHLLFRLAPLVEKIPLVKQVACGQYIVNARVDH